MQEHLVQAEQNTPAPHYLLTYGNENRIIPVLPWQPPT